PAEEVQRNTEEADRCASSGEQGDDQRGAVERQQETKRTVPTPPREPAARRQHQRKQSKRRKRRTDRRKRSRANDRAGRTEPAVAEGRAEPERRQALDRRHDLRRGVEADGRALRVAVQDERTEVSRSAAEELLPERLRPAHKENGRRDRTDGHQ